MSEKPDDEADTKPRSDGGTAAAVTDGLDLQKVALAIVPIVLLGVLLGAFIATAPMAALQDSGGEPLPDVSITHTTLPNEETMVVHVTNNGPTAQTIQQIQVNDALWNFEVTGAGGDNTLDPRESARVVIPYHWQPGWDVHVGLLNPGGATVAEHTIVAPQQTPGLTTDLLYTLAVVGLFVGVIPVVLGMLWFPFMQSMSDRWLHAILAFSAGILAFLAIDAGFEAFELTEEMPGMYEGPALVALGIFGALLSVQSISAWRKQRVAAGDNRASSGLWIAYLVALGIGLHNLAEGLAIGSSFALGRVSLGAFLVLGFMLHNVTEGPAVVAPVARGERPHLAHFGALGVLAGAPVILGGWIGSLAFTPTLGAFFLAIGVGAILQVVWELYGMIDGQGTAGTALNYSTFLIGLVVMYATDLFVAL